MSNNSIYEVERNDYVSFIGQLNKSLMDLEHGVLKDCNYIKILSRKTGKHLCTRIISHDEEHEGEEHYFIFNYPGDDERIAPKAIRQITLKTQEEVQAFFDALNKIQKEEYSND